MKTLKEKLVQEGLIKRQAGMDIKIKIEEWLKEHNIGGYTINDDLTIDAELIVNLRNYPDKELPEYIQFN